MGLENARDSYVDLAAAAAQGKPSSSNRTSFCVNKVLGSGDASETAALQGGNNVVPSDDYFDGDEILHYEPVDVEEEGDEEHWPTWEMTGDDPWRDNYDRSNSNSNNSAATIADCERIFTVPEVYDEIVQEEEKRQKQSSATRIVLRCKEEPCQNNIFNCVSNPWKQQPQTITTIAPRVQSYEKLHGSKNNAFQDPTSDNDYNEKQQKPRGVMKRSSMAVQLYLGMPASSRQSFNPSMFKVLLDCDDNGNEAESGGDSRTCSRKNRASIVGNNHHQMYHDMAGIMDGNDDNVKNKAKNKVVKNKTKNKVHFSELKQVLRVRKITPEEASDVWYHSEAFEHFKNEMTLLIRKDGASRELAEAWLEATNEGSRVSNSSVKSDGSKSRSWWHDYDHSRRGLERYASPGQAREILASYKVAVHKVLGEQQRQRLMGCLLCFFPGISCGTIDPRAEKIAKVYHEYTAWSRDLALAAGASDADAVLTNFDDEKRHSREYYMLKQVVASGYKVHKHMPQFMLPKCIQPKGFLDEAESLYVKNASSASVAGTAKSSTLAGGEEARKEMSRLGSKDLEGPVSPALLPSLQAEEVSNHSYAKEESMPNKSMTEKAKNYPFQK